MLVRVQGIQQLVNQVVTSRELKGMQNELFCGLTSTAWTAIGSIAAAVAMAANGVAIFYAKKSIERNSIASELAILDSLFKEIRNLDQDFVSHFGNWDIGKKQSWCASFYNTVEYLCFLVNHNYVAHGVIRKFFFDEGVVAWRDQLNQHSSDGLINDSETMFSELKKAYRSCKGMN